MKRIVVAGIAAALAGAGVWLLVGRHSLPPPPPSRGVDTDGDPLPPWAVCRIGTKRFRRAAHTVAYTPDGRSLVTATNDGHVRVLDCETGRVTSDIAAQCAWIEPEEDSSLARTAERLFTRAPRPKGHRDWALAAAVSPDASRVFTVGTRDSSIFDLATSREVARWKNTITGRAAWASDGARVVVADDIGGFVVRDASTGAAEPQLPGSAPASRGWEGSESLAVSPGGAIAALKSWRLRVVDLAKGTTLFSSEGGKFAGPAAFSPDGAFLVHHADDEKVLDVRETSTWSVVRRIPLESHSLAFSPDGRTLAVGAESLSLVDFATGAARVLLPGSHSVQPVAFSRDGRRVAALRCGVVHQFDVETGAETPPAAPLSGPVQALAWSPDGRRLALGDLGVIRVCDAATGAFGPVGETGANWLRELEFSADGSRVVVRAGRGADEEWMMSFDAGTGAASDRVASPSGLIWGGRVGADGRHGIAVRPVPSGPSQAVLVDAMDARVIRELPKIELDGGFQVDERNGLVVTSAWMSAHFVVHDPVAAAVVAEFDAPPGARGSDWTACHGRIVMSGDDGSIAVLDERTGAVLMECSSDAEQAWACAAPGGRLVAAVGRDKAIRIYDIAAEAEVARLSGHTGTLTALVFSPDASRLATASEDGTVIVWDVAAATRR